MDRKTTIHVAAEAAVLGALTVYLLGRISTLENEIKELRVDIQTVAKRELFTEQNHAQAIRQIGSQSTSSQPATSHVQPPNAHVQPPRPQVQPNGGHTRPQLQPARPPAQNIRPAIRNQPPVRVAAPQPKKVQFSDEAEPNSDEELLEEEFGSSRKVVEEVESEQEESSEEVQVKAKPKKPSKGIKIQNAPKKSGGARDMDDIKARAAEMARRAGPD